MQTSNRHPYHTRELAHAEDLDTLVASTADPVVLLEGIRALPDSDVELVRQFGRWVAERYPTAIFRTGNAPGTDTAFAEGVAAVAPERIQYVLPYTQHRKAWVASRASSFALDTLPRVAERRLVDLTTEASPKLGRLGELYATPTRGGAAGSKGAYILRDTMKVLGAPELGLAPAKAGIFYANPDDPLAGGTGHTLRVCLLQGVPTVLQSIWSAWMK